jgi:hypothetical protein
VASAAESLRISRQTAPAAPGRAIVLYPGPLRSLGSLARPLRIHDHSVRRVWAGDCESATRPGKSANRSHRHIAFVASIPIAAGGLVNSRSIACTEYEAIS